MFAASDPFLLFDELRVPYAVASDSDLLGEMPEPIDGIRWAAIRATTPRGGAMYWPASYDAYPGSLPAIASFQWAGIPLFAPVLASDDVEALAAREGWQPISPITDSGGIVVASTWRQPNGSIVLPFDPNQAIWTYWTEAYRLSAGRGRSTFRSLALRIYYRFRPILPRPIQLAMRRAYAPIQARTTFPRWPVESALHDLYAALYTIAAEVAGEPVPWIASWPEPYRWALVLTHDVETDVGYRNVSQLRAVEEETGYRSSWNFVPRRYDVADELVRDLTEAGFEVGVHGLYHDGRDLSSAEMLATRLPEIRRWAERWGAVGFRSPATQRKWEWMGTLGFEYDSSYADTAPFEPQPGGCCSWLPFFIDGTVELPITLEQDHTIFVILGKPDASAWIDKATYLRSRGGMALLITHPDYLRTERLIRNYRTLLDSFKDDELAWRALPRDVSDWWRRRAATQLVHTEMGWQASGLAADRVRVLTSPPGGPEDD